MVGKRIVEMMQTLAKKADGQPRRKKARKNTHHPTPMRRAHGGAFRGRNARAVCGALSSTKSSR